jgi:hypothetical protein
VIQTKTSSEPQPSAVYLFGSVRFEKVPFRSALVNILGGPQRLLWTVNSITIV